MISILTLTYQRKHLLEEAIQSYLLQLKGFENISEMVIINDSPDVQYIFQHPNIRIINLKERISSIGKKLEYGFAQCNNKWIYRLDDDDLLSPHALEVNEIYRTMHPTKDILRCGKHYFYTHNKWEGYGDSINNGNCYSKEYIKRVGRFVDRSGDEDNWLTFQNNADIYTGHLDRYTMIYRWGMATYHISSMGKYEDNNYILSKTDDLSKRESGIIYLNPHFKEDYWEKLTTN